MLKVLFAHMSLANSKLVQRGIFHQTAKRLLTGYAHIVRVDVFWFFHYLPHEKCLPSGFSQ